jgi:predicted nuclease of predicted toxin-antitoxin system
MKFLVDAQLPRRLAVRLNELGFDAVHTLDLPDQNRAPDQSITVKADLENRVVISKDADFVNSHLILGAPASCCWFQLETSPILTCWHCSKRTFRSSLNCLPRASFWNCPEWR